jgi:hypothetical protein
LNDTAFILEVAETLRFALTMITMQSCLSSGERLNFNRIFADMRLTANPCELRAGGASTLPEHLFSWHKGGVSPANDAAIYRLWLACQAPRPFQNPSCIFKNSRLYTQMQHNSVVLWQFFVVAISVLCLNIRMERLFDPEAIKAQIANLLADRERIDQTIHALEAALSSVENPAPAQSHLSLDPDISLQDAVKQVCLRLIDSITRQRVTKTIEKVYPLLKPNPSSVAASLANLSKGDNALLKVAVEGRGSAPSVYSTEGDMVLRLNSNEIKELLDDSATKGTGGWQSLWLTLLGNFDKANGELKLEPELRARLYRYYQNYGSGGWQTRIKRVLKRQLPHLFVA